MSIDVGFTLQLSFLFSSALPCGINQKYTPKMPKCIASCSDPNPSGPECSGAIVADDSDEGCECEKGFLMSNDKCVPKEDCGCVDPVGNYVEASFHVLLT